MIARKIQTSLFLLLISGLLLAQDPPVEESGGGDIDVILSMSLEELMNMEIVTAGKKSQSIADIPASIVVITRDDIETYGYQSLEDVIADIPGFYSLGNAFFYGGTNFGVRGFSSPGAFTNVMILVNGVNQMEDFSNGFSTDKITVPVQAIDRIEVVRGPMAVVYGSNAFMGVINIITNDVQQGKKNNLVSASIASLNAYETMVRIGGTAKLAETGEDLHYSFNGSLSTSDGMDLAYSDLQSTPAVLAAYGLAPDARTGGQYQRDNKYFNFSGKFKNFRFVMDYSDRNQGLPGLIPSFDFEKGWVADMTGSNIHAAYTIPVNDNLQIEAKFTNSAYKYHATDVNILAPDQYVLLDVTSKAQEYELNMFYDIADKHKLSVGLYDRYSSSVERLLDAALLGSPNQRTTLGPDPSMNTFAAYTQLDASLGDNLKLVIGARVEKSSNYDIVTQGMDVVDNWVVTQASTTTVDDVQFIPRLAAIYSINSNNTLKLMYSQSKKRPTFVELDNNFRGNGTGLNFANMITFEGNYLTSINNKVSLNASVYYNILSDLVVRTVVISGSTPIVSSTNNGEANTVGAELTLKADIVDNLRAEISLTYQKTEDKTAGMEEVDFAFAPSLLAYIKASYKVRDVIKFGVKARYVGEMEAEWNPASQTRYGDQSPAYILVDVNVYANIYKGLYSNLLVSNLLDEEVRYGSNQNSTWTDKGMLGYGRRVQFTLGFKF
ncbi:MAG: TonB-dependent receptor [Reichenbachiella sp.]